MIDNELQLTYLRFLAPFWETSRQGNLTAVTKHHTNISVARFILIAILNVSFDFVALENFSFTEY